MWAPDVYEGAPLPITAYIAVGSKVAAFALVLRLFAEGLLPAIDQWNVVQFDGRHPRFVVLSENEDSATVTP